MIQKLYDWCIEKAQSKHAEKWLVAVSFADSVFLPIPPDVMLMPMIVADRSRTWRLAFLVTLTSIIGAIVGYILGAFFYDSIVKPMIDFYGWHKEFAAFETYFKQYGIWIVLVGGLTPVPFKVVAISCGIVAMDPVIFALSLIPARAPRFYVEAILLWYFGEPIRDFVEKRLALMFTLFVALFIGGFALLKLL